MYLNTRCRSSFSGWRHNAGIPGAQRSERCHRGGPLVVRAALLALLARPMASTALAQEAVRMSLAGAEAAESRQNAQATPGYYNIQAGPTYWRFGAGLALSYDDNITLVDNNREGDLRYSPYLSAQLQWPVTSLQTLNLTVSGGYTGYAGHPYLNAAYVSPSSAVSFNIFTGDFVINLHDRFSITQNSYQDPTVVGSGSYSQFQNSAGVLVTWDLNKLVVNAGYDHGSSLELTGGQGQPPETLDIFSASTGYMIKPAMLLGLEAGASFEHNSSTTTNLPYTDAFEWNVGPFFQTRVSEYVTFRADAGYVLNSPQSAGSLATATSFSGYFATISIDHRLNRVVEYALSGGKTFSTTLLGGPAETYTANLSVNWHLLRKISLSTAFIYTRGTELILGGETFDQFGPTITLGRTLTKKLSSSIQYQFIDRGSDLATRAYTLDIVSLNLGYQF
jgi:hypothetical protein